MGGLDGCRGGGGRLSLVVLVSEKPNLVSEKSGKSQGILLICGAGNIFVSYLYNPNCPHISFRKVVHLLRRSPLIFVDPSLIPSSDPFFRYFSRIIIL